MLAIVCSGCTLGYQQLRYSDVNQTGGQQLEASGSTTDFSLGIVLDFRAVRVGIPVQARIQEQYFETPEGFGQRRDNYVEKRVLKFDLPLFSIYDFEKRRPGGWPGMLKNRQSLELWLSADLEPVRSNPSYFPNIGLVYYHRDVIGVRLYGGIGSLHYQSSEPGPGGSRWEGRMTGPGGGIEFTITAGEYALDFVRWVLDIDKGHRETYR